MKKSAVDKKKFGFDDDEVSITLMSKKPFSQFIHYLKIMLIFKKALQQL